MAAEISPQPLVVGEIDLNIISTDAKEGLKPSFASITQPKQIQTNLDLFKVNFDHEVPKILFTMEDVNNFTIEEGLHQAVVVKFSYGRPELSEVRRIFSSLFDVKGHCIIGQLEYRHLLVRFDLFNDYVQFLSKSTGYLKSKGDDYFFRTFPWSFGFNPKEETSMAVVWISLPGLPPNLFAKRSILSIASAVGKPLAIDKATQDRSRPSAARVKVILNLLDKHPVLMSAQQNADSIVRPPAVTEKESMDLLLKDDKVAQAADTEGIIDEGRNLESQSLNTISELPLHNDNSGQSIAPNGQSDKSVNSTVALKLIAENDEGSGKQLSHAYLHNLLAVIDKRNSESLLILKGDDTVSNAADQERAIVEAMIPTVNEFQAANVGSDLQVISTDHYGQLNDPNGQTSQFLSSLTPTVALDVTSESDKGKGQQLIPKQKRRRQTQANRTHSSDLNQKWVLNDCYCKNGRLTLVSGPNCLQNGRT